MRTLIALLWVTLSAGVYAAGGEYDCGSLKCDYVKIDLSDKPSLQRGARTFVNYCLTCHSAGFMRYDRMARDLDIPEDLLKDNLMFATDKPGELMKAVMRTEDAQEWFNKAAPPDLTLVTRWHKPEWVYTFMRSFYRDDKSASGWNNAVRTVAMPHVLYEWQGEQRAVYNDSQLARLELAKPGRLTPAEYDREIRDLTNFLVYLGEPAKLDRYRIGIYVLIFLAVFLIFAYLLKKEYWKDVH